MKPVTAPCPSCSEIVIGNVCPRCRYAMPRELLQWSGGVPKFPTVEVVGSLSATVGGVAVLTTGSISALPGDHLFAQVVGRKAVPIVDTTVSVSWGTASIAMLAEAFTYSPVLGTSYARCMNHKVVEAQTATMSFNFSGTIPDNRLVLVVRVRGIVPAAVGQFDDIEEEPGYPSVMNTFNVPATTNGFLVVCHAQDADIDTTVPVQWAGGLTQQARIGAGNIINSIMTSGYPVKIPATITAISGPARPNATGFFWYVIAP